MKEMLKWHHFCLRRVPSSACSGATRRCKSIAFLHARRGSSFTNSIGTNPCRSSQKQGAVRSGPSVFACCSSAAALLEDVRQAIEASTESDAAEAPPKKKATRPHSSSRPQWLLRCHHPQAKRMPNYNLNINSAVDKAMLSVLSTGGWFGSVFGLRRPFRSMKAAA